MELKDLVGERMLSGVTTQDGVVTGKDWADRDQIGNSISFILDGATYRAMEDPQDGYRSSMRELEKVRPSAFKFGVKNVFRPVKVICTHHTGAASGDDESDLLLIKDAETGLIILEVGTDHDDEWYPSFVCDYRPQNLPFNATPETIAAYLKEEINPDLINAINQIEEEKRGPEYGAFS